MRLFRCERKIVIIKRKNLNAVILFMSFLLITVLMLNLIFNTYIPYIKRTAVSLGNIMLNNIINQSVKEEFEKTGYENIVETVYDSEKNVKSLILNTTKANLLKAEITNKITKKMKYRIVNVNFPLIYFFNKPIFKNIGITVPVKMECFGMIQADFENSFSSCGINQTRHLVFVKIKTDYFLISPGIYEKSTVTVKVPVSDSIILGAVPESYTNVTAENEKAVKDDVLNLQ